MIATLPDRTGNSHVIHPTTNMLSIAVGPDINSTHCAWMLNALCSISPDHKTGLDDSLHVVWLDMLFC